MSIVAAMRDTTEQIVDDAYEQLHPLIQPHYAGAGAGATRRDLHDLVEQVIAGLEHHEAVHMVRSAERVAAMRFESGYDLAEVQAAFNAVEQVMWERIVQHGGTDLLTTLARLTSVSGAGKDALARTWVRLASRWSPPSADLLDESGQAG